MHKPSQFVVVAAHVSLKATAHFAIICSVVVYVMPESFLNINYFVNKPEFFNFKTKLIKLIDTFKYPMAV